VGKLFRPGGEDGYGSKIIDKFYQEYERLQMAANSKDKEIKKQGKRYGEAQKVTKALKQLREANQKDSNATNRAARSKMMRGIARKFLTKP
jgi:hypothetical protein